MPSGGRPRTRMSPAQRREQIVKAAATVIALNGVHAFRLVDVAAEAGVSQPLISSYFASRDELIAEAFATSDARAKKLVAQYARGAAHGRERVIAYGLGCLVPDPEVVQSWELWHQVWSIGRFSDELEQPVRDRQRAWISLMAEAVAEGQEDGSIDPSIDADNVGFLIVTLLDGLAPAMRYRLTDVDSAREALVTVIERLLGRSPKVSTIGL